MSDPTTHELGVITDELEFNLRRPERDGFSTFASRVNPPVEWTVGAEDRLVLSDADPNGSDDRRMYTVVAVGKSALVELRDEGVDIDERDVCPAAVIQGPDGDPYVRLLPSGFGEVSAEQLAPNPDVIPGERGFGVAFIQNDTHETKVGLAAYLIGSKRLHLLKGAARIAVIHWGEFGRYFPEITPATR